MVPIGLGNAAIYEDAAISDEAGRWKHFGQSDHVRAYSMQGSVQRLSAVGFTLRQPDRSYFGESCFARHAIHPRSVLHVVEKPAHQPDLRSDRLSMTSEAR